MDPETTVHRRPDVKSWEVDGEAVVYDPATGCGHVLNPTALGIWQLCDGTNTVEDIEREMTAAFPGQEQLVRKDVEATVAQLVTLGLAREAAAA